MLINQIRLKNLIRLCMQSNTQTHKITRHCSSCSIFLFRRNCSMQPYAYVCGKAEENWRNTCTQIIELLLLLFIQCVLYCFPMHTHTPIHTHTLHTRARWWKKRKGTLRRTRSLAQKRRQWKKEEKKKINLKVNLEIFTVKKCRSPSPSTYTLCFTHTLQK